MNSEEEFNLNYLKTLSFVAPFYGWDSTASRLEPLQGGSLLFTSKIVIYVYPIML